ncbi:MAG: LruC domain-containing protein [Oleispira sp.]
MSKHLIFIMLLSVSQLANSAPFETCPTKAFLFQGNPTTVYGVNLVTGTDVVLQDDVGNFDGDLVVGNGNVNGVGFDDTIAGDGTSLRYLFGFNTTKRKFVRLDSDFQQTELAVTNQPSGNFFVGDVYNHHYYFYRKNKGFYKMNLDEAADNYLAIETITTVAERNLTDFAFHPSNDKLYGVDNSSGILYEFDKDTGTTTDLGSTGEVGTFGAGYFDVNGMYYVARNQDGKIYQIDLSNVGEVGSAPYLAVLFATGPLSGQNDGARCANALLIDESEGPSTIDFGDAPDSYNTSLAKNGPRHEIVTDGPYLGRLPPDGEADARLGLVSDDQVGIDDENGIGFVTGLARGLDNVVVVNASKSGYLQAWFDWNSDGDFTDEGEQIFENIPLNKGNNNLLVRVPITAEFSPSWARFRFGSQTDIGITGGAADGEVEDHAIEISDLGVSYQYYPTNGSYVTLAYEDAWPVEGDFDMNDVVFHYRTLTVIKDDQLQRVDVYGQLLAIGAQFHNGFAIRIPGIQASAVDTSKMRYRHTKMDDTGNAMTNFDAVEQANPIESTSDELIAIIATDVWDLVTTSCEFYRTDSDCTDHIQFAFELSLPFTELQDAEKISTLYDPFIFATESFYHGMVFDTQPGRELEIHLADTAPTEQANPDFFAEADDTSHIASERYYKNDKNLPWSMEVATEWKHPRSGIDLLKAYPDFERYVTTNKVENTNWYLEAQRVDNKVYP